MLSRFWKLFDESIEVWLPYKKARVVAQLSAFLVLCIVALRWAPTTYLHISDLQLDTIQFGVLPWLLLFAVVLVQYFVMQEKNSSIITSPWKIHKKITLPVGAYYDVLDKDNTKILRISLKSISEQQMPPPYEWPDNEPPLDFKSDAATLGFEPQFVYHGSCVKKIKTDPLSNERLLALGKINYEELNCSAYFFRTQYSSDSEMFFRCFVDHINPAKQEVELDIYYLSIKST